MVDEDDVLLCPLLDGQTTNDDTLWLNVLTRTVRSIESVAAATSEHCLSTPNKAVPSVGAGALPPLHHIC